jgi:hypothetical protein
MRTRTPPAPGWRARVRVAGTAFVEAVAGPSPERPSPVAIAPVPDLVPLPIMPQTPSQRNGGG